MPLEQPFFVGTAYRTLDAADTQSIAVSVREVATVACAWMIDHDPVICLRSHTGELLAALPWPEDVRDDAAAVRWALASLAQAVPSW